MTARSDHSDRSKRDRIERLRKRVDDLQQHGPATAEIRSLIGILRGLLDLLADEL